MKKLAIAVPTYNRSEDVDYFIDQLSYVFEYDDVDLLIYDSGDNNETEQVVNRCSRDVVRNLLYFRYPSDMPSNEKFFRIYKDLSDKYDYVWMIHDHTVFTSDAFYFIYDKLALLPDFIYLKIHTPPTVTECGICEESNMDEFLLNNAWFLGKIGAAIIRTSSFFKDINWDYYFHKYLCRKRINFSHVGLFFERLAELDNAKVYTFIFPRECFSDTHKFKTLAWDRDRIRISTQGWGEVITALPDSYTNKEDVLKTADRYIITKYILVDFKEKGLYSPAVFIKFKKWINRVFPEVYDDAKKIAFMSAIKAKSTYITPLIDYIKAAYADGRKVYIYGAGVHAYECLKLLHQYSLKPEGFVVSSMSGNPSEIESYPVISLEESTRDNRRLCYVLAVMEIYREGIVNGLNEKKAYGSDIVFCYY